MGSGNKTIRVRRGTHARLVRAKHLAERREDRPVSLDEVIRGLLDAVHPGPEKGAKGDEKEAIGKLMHLHDRALGRG